MYKGIILDEWKKKHFNINIDKSSIHYNTSIN